MFLFLFVVATKASQYTLLSVSIKPLNRVTFFFDSLPKSLNSFLNENKTNLSFTFYNTKSLQTSSIRGEGIINTVDFMNYPSRLEVLIKLNSPRGYTYALLQTSQSLLIEVFDWKTLSQADDNYRMGLLALSDNLSVARAYFEKAFKDKIANAGFFLGMLYIRANLIEDAIRILTEAEKLNCNIPDISILLSQAYSLIGDKAKSIEYQKRYYEATYSNRIKFIEIEPKLRDSIFKDLSNDLIFGEELASKNFNSDSLRDTIKKKPKQNKSDTTHLSIATDTPVVEKVLIYILATIGFLAVMLFSLYIKWKKEKRRITSEKTEFQEELKKQTTRFKVGKPLLTKVYQTETKPRITKPPVIDSPNQINPEVKELAKEILSSRQTGVKTDGESAPADVASTPIRKIPPKLEIAIQIQREQQEIIKSKLKNLEQLPVDTDSSKLIEKANQLGLSKSSIYARQNLSAIEKDKSLTEKLFEKFYFKKKK